MAAFVLTDASVTVNAVDLSDHVKSVRITYEAEEVEDTNMGDTSREYLAGLLGWSVEVEFAQDFAAAKVDATLFPLVGAAPFAISILPTSDGVSATNPNYNGNAILTSYPPLDNSMGELATSRVTLRGTGTLSRSVA